MCTRAQQRIDCGCEVAWLLEGLIDALGLEREKESSYIEDTLENGGIRLRGEKINGWLRLKGR